MQKSKKTENLPADNKTRLAIYDAIYDHARSTGSAAIFEDDLFDAAISRLRVLVPRELHVTGERKYFDEKIEVCLDAGIISSVPDKDRQLLVLTDTPPRIAYPDSIIRDYPAGLELARERLDRDNMRLRESRFNVRKFIPSVSDKPKNTQFQELLSSMREHGFMKQFPVVKYDDGVVVDGLARQRAAEILKMDVEYMRYSSTKDRKAALRRDTPLNRVLVAIHSNANRLSEEVTDNTYKRVADVTRRPWDETAADLELTQEWRRVVAVDYTPLFEVERLSFRPEDEPRVQVTADRKVMLRSLLEVGGLSPYKIQHQLSEFVPIEKARTAFSGGSKADFTPVEELASGIATMQRERQASNRKLDPEWEQIRVWLVRTFNLAKG